MGKYEIKTNPMGNKANIITGDKYRITVITDSLIRMEYNEKGKFVDEPTQTVFNRDLGEVDFKLTETADEINIVTDNLKVYYNKQVFSANGLNIKIYGTNMNYNTEWSYGMDGKGLLGTARTLDRANGSVELDGGIIGRQGFAVLDDSNSLLITNDFVEVREEGGKDIYVFGYGHRYREALKAFYDICGYTPMLPRNVLGNWWSRYYRYTQESYVELMDRFRTEKIPLSVAVIDMDWHLVDIDKRYGSGWTGYTWNKELFPNHKELLDFLHNRGMSVTLNVHPAEGVRGFEECYSDFAEYMGVDAENEEQIEFDAADKKFLKGYFEYVHHPLEEEGVDFWWIDWQQGGKSKIKNLDPLWILNHYHMLDNGRDGKRPMIFSRYAGPGSHRYPVGFSGDTHITWESLEFQPYFTANASNIGYGWWSHDIGGHMLGTKDNELQLRWYQYGVFSPIMRLHSSCNDFSGKEPWNYSGEIKDAMKEIMRFRHKLVPYLYTMNYLAYKGCPLVSPMYYDYPEEWDAYMVPNQYCFGTELLVAPITSPNIKGVNMAKVKVWLPEGMYFDIFTGTVYTGGRYVKMYRDYNSIPVLAKAGAIIPITEDIDNKKVSDNPEELTIMVYPGKDNEFVLYEDDGVTNDYLEGRCVTTKFINQYSNRKFVIEKPVGDMSLIPLSRNLRIIFNNIKQNDIKVKGINAAWEYKNTKEQCEVMLNEWDYQSNIEISFEQNIEISDNNLIQKIYEILARAEISYNNKEDIYRAVKQGKSKEYILSELSSRDVDLETAEAVREVLLAKI